jgi:hypothetical protein
MLQNNFTPDMLPKCMYSFLLAVLCLGPLLAQGQSPQTANEYMSYLGDRESELSKKYLSYMSEAAHGNRARKLEKRRQDLLTGIRQSLSDANKLKPFNGDASLRDAFKQYWDVLFKVFNEDYDKIVNMEEIAEQSYDNMEAYLLAQEKAGDVLSTAYSRIDPVLHAFAAKNNVRIIENETKLSKKLREVGQANGYYHQLYLIFFKGVKQDLYVTDAFNKKDLNSLEQNRATLLKFAAEGLKRLDTCKAYKGDNSVVSACRKVLEFHKKEAEKDIPVQADFLLKNREFEKMKKSFDAKAANKRTQEDVDRYNKAVNDINTSLGAANKTLTDMNKEREKVLNNWDAASKKFMESHVPRGN